jgi:hypothetical protein
MFRRRFPVADMAGGPRATTGMRATAMRFGAMIGRSVEVARIGAAAVTCRGSRVCQDFLGR